MKPDEMAMVLGRLPQPVALRIVEAGREAYRYWRNIEPKPRLAASQTACEVQLIAECIAEERRQKLR
jgi:hypothetical protein